MSKRSRIVAGVGINDSEEPVTTYSEDGVKMLCKYYKVWANMLNRCYRKEYSDRNTTYRGCYVCDEWLSFTRFKSWMIQQNWEGKHLDKDLLVGGNKVYSPNTCLFVDVKVNSTLTLGDKIRGEHPVGVSRLNPKGCFQAACHDGVSKVFLCANKDPMVCHQKWQLFKISVLDKLKDSQDDWMVKIGLQRIIDKIQSDYDNNRETKDFN